VASRAAGGRVKSMRAVLIAIIMAIGAASCGGQTAGGSISGGGSNSQSTATSASGSAACEISASSYDQSCTADTDCVMVSAGDYCTSTACLCGGSAISRSALAQFNANVAKTPVASGAVEGADCGCPEAFGPCCRQGKCVLPPNDPPPDRRPTSEPLPSMLPVK
jgi:hypothetical protein